MMLRKSFVLMVVGTVVRTVWCIPVIFFFASLSSADVPDSINYQGKLTTASGGCMNDTVEMTFTIYSDDQGTSSEWSETQTEVEVKEGIFNVFLGSVNPLPASLFDGSVKYLGVQVESDDEMRPLKPMVSVAYAYRAGTADAGIGGWVDDGPVVRLETATDYVGIGTTTPQGPLQVGEGTFIVDANNDVGIGTTDPESKLHILTAVESAIITLEDETSRPVALRLKNLMGNWSIVSPTNTPKTLGLQFTEGANTRMIIDNNGNVGIGISEPAEKLDVAGTAQMTGFKMPTGAVDGYVLTSDASGVGTWQVATAGADNDWTFRITDTADTTLITGGAWGIARYGSILYGNADSTHVNLGVNSTTGTIGENHKYCTVGGGIANAARGYFAVVAGGNWNTASGWRTTVGGGQGNNASGGSATIGGGQNNIASGDATTVGGGGSNSASQNGATIGGGWDNITSGGSATIGGGQNNTASNSHATVGGGHRNTASGLWATVGGGYHNTASGQSATIPGGYADTADGDYSFAAGRQVRLSPTADYTFAFGYNFVTGTPHAVIFYDSLSEMKVGIQTTSPTARLDVNSSTGYNQIRMRSSYTPTGTSDTNGNVGDIAWDDNYFYVKTSAGWKRVALSTW